MKNKFILLFTTISILLLSACGQSVPEDKALYVGHWESQTPTLFMQLQITQDGKVIYQRKEQNTSTSLDLPLQEFNGNHFKAGIGPASTVFTVSKPPYKEGKEWKMVVDGVELTKLE